MGKEKLNQEILKEILDENRKNFKLFQKHYFDEFDRKIFALKSMNNECSNVLLERINGKWLFSLEEYDYLTEKEFRKIIKKKDFFLRKKSSKLYLNILLLF